MVRILILWLALLLPGWAAAEDAGPAEPPPPGFTAQQYVDSTGCVFRMEGRSWLPRKDADGQAICGYPPTPRADVVVAAPPPDPALQVPGLDDVEARLLLAVTGEMRPGDYIGGDAADRPASVADLQDHRGEVAPAPLDRPDGQVAAAMALAPRIAATGAADLHPDRRLCALLGAEPRGAGMVPGLAQDPTGGYCAAALIGMPSFDYSAAKPTPAVSVVAALPAPSHPRMAKAVKPAPALPVKTPPVSAAKAAPRHESKPQSAVAMIPAGARWLEVGRFPAGPSSDAAVQRLAAAGFPVGRSVRGHSVAVLAGPFASRKAIVTARDRLLRAGYRGIVPR